MPQESSITRAAKMLSDRMLKVQGMVKDKHPGKFGSKQLSEKEFRKRVETDESFRVEMGEKMGPQALIQFMTEGQ